MTDAFDALVSRAQAALEVGRPEEGERAAREALALSPGDQTAAAVLARALAAQGRHDDALRAAEAGLAASPDSEWLHRLRAVALRALKRRADALAAADEAVRLAPDHGAGHHLRSVVLEELKRVPEAREASGRAIALDPEAAVFHAQLGDLWLKEDPARAERHYRDALALDPESAMVLNNLGVALLRTKRAREAALAFRSAVLLDPSLEIAKANTRAAFGRMVGGGSVLLALVIVVQGARFARHLASREVAAGLAAAGLLAFAGWLGVWTWRRTVGTRRLAAAEPQLHALVVRLEADRKLRRWRWLRR